MRLTLSTMTRLLGLRSVGTTTTTISMMTTMISERARRSGSGLTVSAALSLRRTRPQWARSTLQVRYCCSSCFCWLLLALLRLRLRLQQLTVFDAAGPEIQESLAPQLSYRGEPHRSACPADDDDCNLEDLLDHIHFLHALSSVLASYEHEQLKTGSQQMKVFLGLRLIGIDCCA